MHKVGCPESLDKHGCVISIASVWPVQIHVWVVCGKVCKTWRNSKLLNPSPLSLLLHCFLLLSSISLFLSHSLAVVVWSHHVGNRHAWPDSVPWGRKQWDLWLLETGEPSQTASRLSGLHVSAGSFAAHSSQNTLSRWWSALEISCPLIRSTFSRKTIKARG